MVGHSPTKIVGNFIAVHKILVKFITLLFIAFPPSITYTKFGGLDFQLSRKR